MGVEDPVGEGVCREGGLRQLPCTHSHTSFHHTRQSRPVVVGRVEGEGGQRVETEEEFSAERGQLSVHLLHPG